MINKKFGFFVLSLFLISTILLAQDTLQTGAISGKVIDSDGTPLPGVTVTIRSEALIKGIQSTVSTANGGFRFVLMPVGKYEITFERHVSELAKLRDDAMKKGAWAAAINAEVARGKAGGLYVDQK